MSQRKNSTASVPEKKWRDPEHREKLETELRQRIAGNTQARKYFAHLTGPAGLDPQYVITSLIRDAFVYEVPAELAGQNGTDFLGDYGSADLPKRVRKLAEEVQEAESNTPDFGLDDLDIFQVTHHLRLRTIEGREEAVRDLTKLPETLRLYADYFEKSRTLWRALGRVERKAKERFESAVRDHLQGEIHQRTGKYSDLRYSRLVNLAREVVGKAEMIDPKTLVERRRRKRTSH